jgi:hypothetical protein
MAETMKFEDLKELGSEAECKAKGKYTQNGKNYLVQVQFTAFLLFAALSQFHFTPRLCLLFVTPCAAGWRHFLFQIQRHH